MAENNNTAPNIVVLKFADAKIPVFKESRRHDFIKCGEDNEYPKYLTYLYNKSAKHNAIINGKAFYVFGEGFANGEMVVNRFNESLNDITKKAIKDVEIYGGFYWEIVWNRKGKVGEIYHVDRDTIRKGKEEGFWYKENWNELSRDEPEFIEDFDPSNPVGTQIFEYIEYRPGVKFYPLPSYIGCNNFIETDIEISKYYLSSIRNGMMPSKMVQFFTGDPGPEAKQQVEDRFKKKFTGAENAGGLLLVYNAANAQRAVEINDLSASDLDKHFVELNKTCQQEIFAGHGVTSPMLFGIKTEGQLGGSGELKTAYEIFSNTYAGPKADAVSKEIEYLMSFSDFAGEYDLEKTDPVGIQFDVKDVIQQLPKSFVFKALGIPEEVWNSPNIGGTAVDTVPTTGAPTLDSDVKVNDHIKNLSAKQHQELMRIIRQFTKGQLNEKSARALLRTGLGLSDQDINDLLGIDVQPVQMSAQDEDYVIGLFDSCGESKNDFEIIKSKKVGFAVDEIEEDEAVFIKEAFKTFDVTRTEEKILDLIRKDKRITPEVIAQAIGESKSYVESKIDSLSKKGYLESVVTVIGIDEIIERNIPKELDIVAPPPTPKSPSVEIFVKYSYEPKPGQEAIIPTTRPFCRKLISLNRLYSRAEIEKISQRLGYSVWDRKGGWWGKKEECRHRFLAHIVVKKGGAS